MRALTIALLVGCGGEIVGGGGTDASAGNLPCGDASCNAAAEYCYETPDASACKTLPHACKSCECANPPQPGLLCVCTSGAGAITVSCRSM